MALIFFFVFIILLPIVYLLLYLHHNYTFFKREGIAYEKPNYLVGNLTGVQRTRGFPDIWMEYYKKFKGTGPFAGFYWFHRPSAFVLEPYLAKLILTKEFHKFADRHFFCNEKDDPLSGHLFLLNGHKWRKMRKIISPTFTSGKMKYMFPTVIKVGYNFLNVFSDMVRQNAIVEIKDLLARFTTDVIGTCAFGIDCNSLKDPEAEFRMIGRRALIDTRHGFLGTLILSSFPQQARKMHLKQTPEYIEQFFLRIVRETVAERERNEIKRNDFMDLLIDLKNGKTSKTEDDDRITLEEIAAQAFVFFLGGFETSSSTLSFALYELALHPEIQDRARNEINEVLERHNKEYTYEAIKEMRYVDQIFSEILRLYTIVPILNRVCLEDYQVPGHPKYVIKKGMYVFIPSGAIHRDPDYYPHPDEFNPDNFSTEKVNDRDSALWLPFGDGPRNCIGLRFGQMQTRIALAMLLKNFKFSVCSKTQIPPKYNKKPFIIATESGIYLNVQKL